MALQLVRRGLLLAVCLLPLSALGQSEQVPSAPVEALDSGLLAIMRAGSAIPFEQRVSMLTPVVQRSFDLPTILQNSVGPRFASLPPDQQAELLATFTSFTVASYVANFDAFSGQRFDVDPDIRKAGADDVVQTRIVSPSGEPARLDYVVRASGGAYRIVDVLLDGSISRVAVQRSDFRSLLAGGDAGPLIASLRNKVAGLSAGKKE